MGPDGLRAECSHCDYSRRFSPELSGRYFRCPKCRQGVLAVPRASNEDQQRWRSSEESWLHPSKGEAARAAAPAGGDPSETPDGIVALGRAAGQTAGEAAATPTGRRRSSQRVPKVAKETKTDLAPIPVQSSDGSADAPVVAETSKETTSSVDAPESDDPGHRGEIATARRIMVECGLCGFLVGIPPAFFGKTVHCPECAGDTVFSESTLEPVKDELIDRMALETAERDVLFRLDGPRATRWTTLRSFFVGVALGLVAIFGIWGFVASRRSAYRDAAVENAVRGGWRYATNEDDLNLLHEPWCRDLSQNVAAKYSEEQRASRPALTLHECE